MKTKIKSIIIGIVAVAIGYMVSNPTIFNICNNVYQFNNYAGCSDSTIKSIGSPLLIFSSFILFTTLIAALFSGKVFQSWLRCSMWAIPLAIIFIVVTPVSGSRMGIDFFPFYRDDAARLAGGLFAATSFFLIAWKYFSSRRANT